MALAAALAGGECAAAGQDEADIVCPASGAECPAPAVLDAAVEKCPYAIDALLRRSECALAAGRAADAAHDGELAVRAARGAAQTARAAVARGAALEARLELAEAVAVYKDALRLSDAKPLMAAWKSVRGIAKLLTTGDAEREAGRLDAALAAFDELAEKGAERGATAQSLIQARRGAVLAGLRRYAEAIKAFTAALGPCLVLFCLLRVLVLTLCVSIPL